MGLPKHLVPNGQSSPLEPDLMIRIGVFGIESRMFMLKRLSQLWRNSILVKNMAFQINTNRPNKRSEWSRHVFADVSADAKLPALSGLSS